MEKHSRDGLNAIREDAPQSCPVSSKQPFLQKNCSQEVVPYQDQAKSDVIDVLLNDDSVDTSSRILPSVGAFTAQCSNCMKWRLIPTKEQYEQIRQSILEKPFYCSNASGWRPGASCDDPPDLSQDMNHVWAIDKPNIPLAPKGWERLLVIRGAGASKFADVYYLAPSGRKLRSMPEVERFLAQHPEYVEAGVTLSQFSFVIPRPLDRDYLKKKSPEMRGSILGKRSQADNVRCKLRPFKASSSEGTEQGVEVKQSLAEEVQIGKEQS